MSCLEYLSSILRYWWRFVLGFNLADGLLAGLIADLRLKSAAELLGCSIALLWSPGSSRGHSGMKSVGSGQAALRKVFARA